MRSGNRDTLYGDWVGHQELGELRQTKAGIYPNYYYNKHPRILVEEGDIELTDCSNNSIGTLGIGDYEFPNVPAHVGNITSIKGMRIQLARVERGRVGPEEEAENWKDVKETHGAGKAGRNTNAPSEDEARIQPST